MSMYDKAKEFDPHTRYKNKTDIALQRLIAFNEIYPFKKKPELIDELKPDDL